MLIFILINRTNMVLYSQKQKNVHLNIGNMLKISKLADYATVILSLLSTVAEEKFSASGVSDKTGIPTPTVSKVLKLLNEANLVVSTRGVNGGYQIRLLAEEISLKDIITAIDGRPALTECTHDDQACTYRASCGLRPNWEAVNQKILNLLSELSLADMNRPVDEPLLFYPQTVKKVGEQQ
jgi:FeS assembly SUF system regulator